MIIEPVFVIGALLSIIYCTSKLCKKIPESEYRHIEQIHNVGPPNFEEVNTPTFAPSPPPKYEDIILN